MPTVFEDRSEDSAAESGYALDPEFMQAKLGCLQFFNSLHPRYAKEKPFFSNIPFLQTRASNSNVLITGHDVSLFDVRGHETKLNLDKNGFELVNWHHTFPDLKSSVTQHAYPGVVELLKNRLGSNVQVVVFDHTFRRSGSAKDTEMEASIGLDKDKTTNFGRPSNIAHSDQTYDGTVRQIQADFGPDAGEILKNRFRVINVWKPLKTPVRQRPLVLCDSRTCRDDGHPCDLVYPHMVSENKVFAYSDTQRWYYLSDQTDDETWLIKIMDSASQQDPDMAECTAHTSFLDKDPALKGETRQSVEFRAYVFGG